MIRSNKLAVSQFFLNFSRKTWLMEDLGDRSGGRDLRRPLLEERKRDAGALGMHVAESNEQTDQSSLAQTVSASSSRSFS